MAELQLASRQQRHSFPFTHHEFQARAEKAAANQAFDSSLKLRPLLPRIDVGDLIQNLELPPIREFLNEALSARHFHAAAPTLTLDNLPLKLYKICGKKYIMQVPQGSESIVTQKRITQDGRELTYRLEMCQQPRQARACGNGARSSADRRPVDPPPVISLTIKHGQTDITSSYEAAFMLFASLEHVRPVARGTLAPTHVCPVITGVCVAGAAYLTKPSNAAYFIFPDLSVRHEGYYRLKFHLFEQTKRQGDMDEGVTISKVESSCENPLPEQEHENMVNRAFIYSEPFQVFSAKKFPGLQPSTELSKVIADQGCRVRIRRDVRQRRAGDRKPKPEEDLSQRSLGYTYQHAGGQESPRELAQQGPPRDSRRMSADSQASHHYGLARHPSFTQSTKPSPALPGLSQYAPDRTAPSTPIIAEPEHLASSRYGQTYPPTQLKAPSAPPYTISSPRPSAAALQSALPSMVQLLGPQKEPSRPPGGLYALPPPTAQKRSARSPEPSPIALKDGARPTMTPPTTTPAILGNLTTSRLAHESRMSLCYGDAIIAADDEEDEAAADDEILDNPYTYRRATGDKITNIQQMRQAWRLRRRG